MMSLFDTICTCICIVDNEECYVVNFSCEEAICADILLPIFQLSDVPDSEVTIMFCKLLIVLINA
jgi:hypothetical protein